MSLRIFIRFLAMLFIMFLLLACHSKKNKNIDHLNTSEKIEQYSDALPQGTANVSATLLHSDVPDNSRVLIFKIVAVTGYGSSTPPLAIGAEVRMDISENLSKHKEFKMFETDSLYSLNIRHKVWGVAMDDVSEWEILKILK